MELPSLNVENELLDPYCIAYDKVEGDSSLLALLVMFYSPDRRYSEVKSDFDNGENIETYLGESERINAMKPAEVKLFLKCYGEQVDGLMSWLREAVVDSFKAKKPKADVESVKGTKKIVYERSLFD